MNNDQWIAFQDSIPPDARWIFEKTREHDDYAYLSVLKSLLEMFAKSEQTNEGIRGQLARYIGNQEMITEHLKRQDQRDTEHDKQFAAFVATVTEWRQSVEQRLDTFERALTQEVRAFRREQGEFNRQSSEDRSTLHTDIQRLERKVDALSARVAKLEGGE